MFRYHICMSRSARILVVDDEPLVRRSIARSLHQQGHVVDHVADGPLALGMARQHPYDVAIVAYPLPEGIDSFSLLSQIRELQALCMPILMTGMLDMQTAVDALNRAEVVSILRKPFDPVSISEAVERALSRQEQLRPLEAERQRAMQSGRMFEECVRHELTHLALQPIVSARHPSRIIAVECLLRSTHPVLSGPEPLLRAAEQGRKVWALGKMVNRLAAKVAIGLPEKVLLFVNIHPHQLDDPELLAQFEPLFSVSSRVVLEITERAGLHGVPNWDAAVNTLTNKGFQFAVDDLGAGHNGLLLLAQLQPTFIKVDQSIVRDCHQENRKQRLISMLANFAEATGASLVAEGVETGPEAQTLIEAGAHLLQGYHYGRPTTLWPIPGFVV